MQLTDWQHRHLSQLAPVPGLDPVDARTLVGRFAFSAGDDLEAAQALGRIETSDRTRLALTMFTLGMAAGHASEAWLASRNPQVDVLDLRAAEFLPQPWASQDDSIRL
jgi:hypothetical protein